MFCYCRTDFPTRTQFTLHIICSDISSSLLGSLAKGLCLREILQKFCGNLQNVRKECGNSAESLRKFRRKFQTNLCNDAFPSDPISDSSRGFLGPCATHRRVCVNSKEGYWVGVKGVGKRRHSCAIVRQWFNYVQLVRDCCAIVSPPNPEKLSAALQQSEICVKFSVFHTVFDMKFW